MTNHEDGTLTGRSLDHSENHRRYSVRWFKNVKVNSGYRPIGRNYMSSDHYSDPQGTPPEYEEQSVLQSHPAESAALAAGVVAAVSLVSTGEVTELGILAIIVAISALPGFVTAWIRKFKA